MASIPDPRTAQFSAAPPGTLRVVAWRQRTDRWPDPDLLMLHQGRSQLLHRWVDEHNLVVTDWGQTDGERPAENVQLLLQLAETGVTVGLTALITESVKAFFDYRKAKRTETASKETEKSPTAPTDEIPLFGVTIINESGGTVVVMHPPKAAEVAPLIQQVIDPAWSDHHLVI